MPNLNKVILLGRLTKTPEIRFTPNGKAVSDLGVATNRVWKNSKGEKQFETTYSQVTMWGKHAETICKFLEKGSPIFIEGRVHLERWKSPEGEPRQKMKIMGENFQFVSAGKDKEETT